MTAVISQAALTDTVTLSTTDFANIVSTISFTLLVGANVRILAYNIMDPSSVQTRFKIDGTDVLESVGGQAMMLNKFFATGSHTIDYQAISFGATTTTTRGITVENLDLL